MYLDKKAIALINAPKSCGECCFQKGLTVYGYACGIAKTMNKDTRTRPAVSRKDRKTEICPDCGTKQALDTVRDLLGPEMTDQQWEGYKSGFLKRSREGQHGQNTL